MSNRHFAIGRIPLIPDPLAALKAGAMVNEAIEQTEKVKQYSDDFFAPPRTLWHALRRCGDAMDRASYVRDLSVMEDRELEMHGVDRDRIHEVFFKAYFGGFQYRPNNVRAGDTGR